MTILPPCPGLEAGVPPKGSLLPRMPRLPHSGAPQGEYGVMQRERGARGAVWKNTTAAFCPGPVLHPSALQLPLVQSGGSALPFGVRQRLPKSVQLKYLASGHAQEVQAGAHCIHTGMD